jgi:hypothetical protein
MSGPPGDDDDQPITLVGGSLDIYPFGNQEWVDVDDFSAVYSYSQPATAANPMLPGAKSRIVVVTAGDNDPLVIPNTSGMLTVQLQRKVSGIFIDELSFSTDDNGQNLTIATRVVFRAYYHLENGHRRHPNKSKRVEQVVITTTNPAIVTKVPISNGDFSMVIQSSVGIP